MSEFEFSVRAIDEGRASALANTLGLRGVTARCLASRGVEVDSDALAYLRPRLGDLRAPDGLAGLGAAVGRLIRALERGEPIGCFGDYDVDGITSCAVVAGVLRRFGGEVIARVARRDAGYGFGVAEAEAFAAAGVRLIVTTDCGTSDVAAIAAAAARGIDVIVIDHHTVPSAAAGAVHPAFALINPFRADSQFPFRGLASVGLAFYVMQALRGQLRAAGWFRDRPEPDLRDWLDLVAIGTIADLVPLQRENRILTSHGLKLLAERRRPGLAALLDAAEVRRGEPIDERTVGFRIAPRLNAPGRLGDAAPALALLLAEDAGEAAAAAAILEQANTDRRAEQDRVWQEAQGLLATTELGPAIVVAGTGWAPGVVGIVAAKLVEAHARPAFVIALDPASGEGRGSARSFGGVDLYRALAGAGEHMIRFGGHAAAAGLTVAADQVAALRAALWREVAAQTEGAAERGHRLADAEVSLGEVDLRLCEELAALAPFGKENEAPVLIARGLTVRQSRRVGDGSHLKLLLEDGSGAARQAIGFGLGARDPGEGSSIDAAFAPTISTYGGGRVVELTLRDLGRP